MYRRTFKPRIIQLFNLHQQVMLRCMMMETVELHKQVEYIIIYILTIIIFFISIHIRTAQL